MPFQYKKLLGYRKGLDGKPEIEPQEAETVRRIYRRYLDGCSLSQIQQELEADRVPTAQAVQRWSYQVIRNILTNERYIGDAMLGKTFITDCISKRVKKNNGERGQSYVENNHPAIIPRELFYRVQEEMTRRASKRKVMQKTGKTELGKYSAKYALSELLVCGECGTPYKRVTWARNGKSGSFGGASPDWNLERNTAITPPHWTKKNCIRPSRRPSTSLPSWNGSEVCK